MNAYTFHISLYDLASLATLFSGLSLALVLGFAKRPNQTANVFLSSALVVIVLKTGGLTPFFLPALGPLLYFYVRQLTCHDRQFRWKDTLHFCPLLVGYRMPAWLVLISVIIYLYLSHRLIVLWSALTRPRSSSSPRRASQSQPSQGAPLGMTMSTSETARPTCS